MTLAAQRPSSSDGTNFDPTLASTWLARGRSPDHADALASAWRSYPDLPSDAPLEDRQQRFRARVCALRPVNEAMRVQAEAEREANNFAYIERRIGEGEVNDRYLAILRGRDRYGYGWDLAGRYAGGWHAARAGWPHNYSDAVPCREPRQVAQAAYDQGFSDGGGDRTDLFDVARRTYLADQRRAPVPEKPATTARPLPSQWSKPTDAQRPACWSRRLAIISDQDSHTEVRAGWNYLQLISHERGAENATVLVLTNTGLLPSDKFIAAAAPAARSLIDVDVASAQLRDLVAGRAFDDVLVALDGEDLVLLDRIAAHLPLAKSMERTGNTRIQRRAHLRTWLDRGYCPDAAIGGGHVRWGKLIHGYTAKLGEFTARHVGPAPAGGHLVRIEIADGRLADGYAGPSGASLPPELVVSSKARLRSSMTAALRTFAGATPLMASAA